MIPHRHGKRKRVNHVTVKQRWIIFSSHFVHETKKILRFDGTATVDLPVHKTGFKQEYGRICKRVRASLMLIKHEQS